MATQDDDENKKYARGQAQQNANSNASQPTDGGMGGGMGGGTNTPPARSPQSVAYPFQRTLQTPSASQPGQQTAMPWSQMAPSMANFGRSATPWAQTMQPQQAPQTPMQGQQSAPQGIPNWQALMQRFGGGNAAGQATAPSPAFQQPRFQMPWMQGGGQAAAGGGGFQLPPFLQQAAQAIAARGGGGFQMPGFGGPQGATPSWGGGMAMPNWGGAQGLPIFNQQRNVY